MQKIVSGRRRPDLLFFAWLREAALDIAVAAGHAALQGLGTALCMGVVYFGFAIVWAIRENETLLTWNTPALLAFGMGVIFFVMTPVAFVTTLPEARQRRRNVRRHEPPAAIRLPPVMPYVPRRRPLYTIVTDAALGVGAFGYWGMLNLLWILPILALCVGVILLLEGPPAFRDWAPGKAQWIPFAGTVGVVFFAGLLLATYEYLLGRGYVWAFEENARCDERAIRFVSDLLAGKRRLAYERLHETARERTTLQRFEAEWKAFELSPDARADFPYAEAAFDEYVAPSIPPHRYGSRLRKGLAVVDVRCVVEEQGRKFERAVRVDLVRVDDDWFVAGWRVEPDEDFLA